MNPLIRRCVVCTLCLAIGACASTPKPWTRIDGKQNAQDQLAVDETICRGEMQKAAVTQREAKVYLPWEENPFATIYAGCMAQHGYMRAGG
jgi:hypothetical protein